MAAIERALVLGGGPAGLVAATSLSRTGVDVVVAELALDQRELGSELMISSPALRALDRIGLAQGVAARGVPIDSCEFYTSDGVLQASVPTPHVAGDRLPASVGITRQAFYAALHDCAVVAGVTLENDTTIADLRETGDGVSVDLTNGQTHQVDLVIGADGWNSALRALRFPRAGRPQYSGQCVWRARAPRRGEGALGIYFGRRTNAGLITVDEENSYVFCLVNRQQPGRVDRALFHGLFLDVLAEFGGDVGWSRDHLEPDTIHFAPIFAHIMASPWYAGRVLLIGDAAHATTPHIAYGAGLAVEDGAALGPCVAAASSLNAALEAFMVQRFDRCRMVVENGLQVARWQQGLDAGTADQAALTDQTWHALAANVG